MNAAPPPEPQPWFAPDALSQMRAAYPNAPTLLRHRLTKHPLLTLDALAALSARLGAENVEYNAADLPIGIMPEDVPGNGLDIADTIGRIAANQSWAVLKFVERDPAYRALIDALLAELMPVVGATTGPMETVQGFIFISSPNAMTPFHFDPEHNVLLQVRGHKVMTVFPAGDARFAAGVEHERYHSGGHRNLPWDDGFAGEGFAAPLGPGDAVLVPVMAPHFVRNGAEASVSLSITWRSGWSYREAEAHRANAMLRRLGMSPAMPPRWPDHGRLRSLGWRAARRLGLVR